jgi:hypothetical protein
MCPHTTIYVSSFYYICVLILLYTRPHTAINVEQEFLTCSDDKRDAERMHLIEVLQTSVEDQRHELEAARAAAAAAALEVCPFFLFLLATRRELEEQRRELEAALLHSRCVLLSSEGLVCGRLEVSLLHA